MNASIVESHVFPLVSVLVSVDVCVEFFRLDRAFLAIYVCMFSDFVQINVSFSSAML